MKIREYIEEGEQKAGSQIALAKLLNLQDSALRGAKANIRGLPDAACIVLADLIGADRLEVIAASNLVTEKNVDRRAVFQSCFAKAASIVLAVSAISIMTPSPAEAAPVLKTNTVNTVYYVKYNMRKFAKKAAAAFGKILTLLLPARYADC